MMMMTMLLMILPMLSFTANRATADAERGCLPLLYLSMAAPLQRYEQSYYSLDLSYLLPKFDYHFHRWTWQGVEYKPGRFWDQV